MKLMKPLVLAGSDLSSVETQLEDFGMKKTLARVYVALLANGQSSADELSQIAGIHRVDIYKRLEEMTRIGLCNLRLGRPKTYTAVDPGIIVDSLVKNRMGELRRLSDSKSKLVPLLRRIESSAIHLPIEKELSYELMIGRRQVYDATRRILRLANKEVIRVISPNGIKRSYRHGLLKEYVECGKRGVTVQIITDVTKLPKRLISYCASNFEIRHSKESSMKLLVVDKRLVMLSGMLDDDNMSLDSSAARSLASKDENLAEMLSIIFRHLWDTAEIVKA